MKPGVFREEYIAIIVRELLRGLEYLHTEGKLHRDIKGTKLIFPFLLPLICLPSCQHTSLRRRGRQARRLRCLWSTVWYPLCQEEHIRRYTVLDVTRSYQTKRIRSQGRYLESGNNRYRVGQGRTPICRTPSNEGQSSFYSPARRLSWLTQGSPRSCS